MIAKLERWRRSDPENALEERELDCWPVPSEPGGGICIVLNDASEEEQTQIIVSDFDLEVMGYVRAR